MNYFTVRVLENGRPEANIGVSGGMNHGIYAGGTPDFYTDNEGYAVLSWNLDTYLDTIYIRGTAYRGEFYDGGQKLINI